MQVRKRNGNIVDFDESKISNAIRKAFIAAEVEDTSNISDSIARSIERFLRNSNRKDDIVTIDEIQNLVECYLMRYVLNHGDKIYDVAKRYILYRDRRDKDRSSINKLTEVFSDLVNISDTDIKKGNANINGNTPAGQMLIFGAETAKDYATNFLLSPKYAQAHKDGYIHIHDLDFYPTKTWTCNQIDLVDLFNKDYIYTNDSIMRKPKRISSYGALAAIVMQSEQNEQHGGQSILNFDYAMAQGVRLTFKEIFKKYFELVNDEPFIDDDNLIYMDNKELEKAYPYIYRKALLETEKETHEAMAAFIYNLVSMHSRGGAQIVFSSINYGTDDSSEGRMVISAVLDAIDEGLGDGSTAIFPISVFKVKNGVNFSQEDWELAKNNWEDAMAGKLEFKTKSFDLFLKACKVSSRRLFPNFVFLDSTFNTNNKWRAEDPNRYKYEVATMGCRTRVYSDVNGEKTSARRGNLSFTTINLVRLAIEAMNENRNNEEERIRTFFDKLDYYIHLVHDQLKERYKWQVTGFAKQFPFIVKNAMVMGTENIHSLDDKIGEDVLKHGTLGIGYIGLAECLKALIGKHHGESEEAQALGLKIVGRIREACDAFTEKEKLNYGCFATPAENLAGTFTKRDKKKFGIIQDITDKDYYTNSSHVPVYCPISALKKIQLEAPYHDLANAGNITYIELDGEAKKNVKAFATVIVAMHDNNIGYGSVNHAADHCDVCGYEGPIEEHGCPNCGNKDENHITRIRRITGYLTGDVKSRWNSYKQAELKDRVKHMK